MMPRATSQSRKCRRRRPAWQWIVKTITWTAGIIALAALFMRGPGASTWRRWLMWSGVVFACGLIEIAIDLWDLRAEARQNPMPTSRPRYWPSRQTWTAYGLTLVLALGFCFWDAVHNDTPDTHPLQPERLWLRVIGISFMIANFTIAGTVGYRFWRLSHRLRNNLCPTCGYDLRHATPGGRCPECGSPVPAGPGASRA
jgi:hypothetical protein